MIIKKITDEVERLPLITDTPLWPALDPDRASAHSKAERQLAMLYNAVEERENYFQDYTPTHFGNPDFDYRRGVVKGILQAMEAYEYQENGYMVFRSDRKILLKVEILNRPESYYKALRENREDFAGIL